MSQEEVKSENVSVAETVKSEPHEEVIVNPPDVSIIEDGFGILKDMHTKQLKLVRRYTMTNKNGVTVQIINYGATVIKVVSPDKDGTLSDILLGSDNLKDFLANEDHMLSAICGRVASVITGARFRLNGVPYFLYARDGKNFENGGYNGFNKVLWESRIYNNKVIMTHLSPDKTEGFPGNMLVQVTYELTVKNQLIVDMEAISDKETPIDIRHGLYFNLAGHDAGEKGVLEHQLRINASNYIDFSEETGLFQKKRVQGTRFDFEKPRNLKKLLHLIPRGGYDHIYCVNMKPPNDVNLVARIVHMPTGRSVEVLSNQPTVRFYTGRYLPQAQWQKDRVIPQSSPDKEGETGDDDYDAIELIPKKVYFKRRLLCTDSESPVENNSLSADDSNVTITISPSQTAEPVIDQILSMVYTANDKATSTIPYPIKLDKSTSMTLSYRDKATSTTPLVITLEKDGDGTLSAQYIPPDPDEVAEWEKRILEVLWCVYDQLDRLQPCVCDFECGGIPSKPVFGIRGAQYQQYGGICLTSQDYPDAVNQVKYPSCTLKPGKRYRRRIVYHFCIVPPTTEEIIADKALRKQLQLELEQRLKEEAEKAEIPSETGTEGNVSETDPSSVPPN